MKLNCQGSKQNSSLLAAQKKSSAKNLTSSHRTFLVLGDFGGNVAAELFGPLPFFLLVDNHFKNPKTNTKNHD